MSCGTTERHGDRRRRCTSSPEPAEDANSASGAADRHGAGWRLVLPNAIERNAARRLGKGDDAQTSSPRESQNFVFMLPPRWRSARRVAAGSTAPTATAERGATRDRGAGGLLNGLQTGCQRRAGKVQRFAFEAMRAAFDLVACLSGDRRLQGIQQTSNSSINIAASSLNSAGSLSNCASASG